MKRANRLAPEIACYTKYYEHDGMLRAYANRSILLAAIFGALAMGSLGFAIYVRVQPPTVIRVDKDGNAVEVSGPSSRRSALADLAPDPPAPPAVSGTAPSDIEGRALVRHFLTCYLAYTPDSVDRNFAEALNLMTANLRQYTMNRLREDDTIGKIRADHLISDFEIRSIEPVKDTPWTYTVFGTKEIHRVKDQTETTDQIVAKYNVRLVETSRTETNPSGLLVAQYGEQQMVGDREDEVLRHSDLDSDK